MPGKFSHKGIGQIQFFLRESDNFTGTRIRGTQLLAATAFRGTVYLQQYQSSAFTFSYFDFSLEKSVQLQWDCPSFSYYMIFVLEGKLAFGSEAGSCCTLTKGHYAFTDKSPQFLQLFESENAVILVVACNSNIPIEQELLGQAPIQALAFSASMKLLLSEFLSNEYNELLLELYYEKLVKELLFCYLVTIQDKLDAASKPAIPKPIKAAHELILQANRDTLYSLAELAELTGISESTLKKGYKKYYGTSPFDEQVLLRLEWAREQLETTDLPSSELFRQAGYAYLTGFLKAFKKQYGISPNQWRKLNKK